MSDTDTKQSTADEADKKSGLEKILPDSMPSVSSLLGGTEIQPESSIPSEVVVPVAPQASAIPKPPADAPVVGVLQHPKPQPAVPVALPSQPQPMKNREQPPIFGSRIGKMVSIILGLGLFIAMIGLIIFFLVSPNSALFSAFKKEDTVVTTNTNTAPTNSAVVNTSNTNSASTNTESVVPNDADGDGLLDNQEAGYQTNPKKIDTDGDELTDRQEIEIYKTSPTKKDTDGDGFSDGSEVRNFYNPNGPGNLINVPEAIDSLSNSAVNGTNVVK